MSLGPHHITIEDCEVHHVDVGINFRSSMHHVTVRRNHVHDTGPTAPAGARALRQLQRLLRDERIGDENSWIHDTLTASQETASRSKLGSWGNVVRDSVVYNTKYPGILLYGTMGQRRNVVSVTCSGTGDSGIRRPPTWSSEQPHPRLARQVSIHRTTTA